MARYTTYSAFFDFYLSEHSLSRTRALHYIGSSFGIAALILCLAQAQPLWLLAGLIAGYGFAWIGHFFVEKNRPATFTYPLWSFFGDYHMFWLWITGQLNRRRTEAEERIRAL